jgi:hypothetical protein
MKTFEQLKEQCTPEIIKKMCELAEGFDLVEGRIFYNGIAQLHIDRIYYSWNTSVLSLLLHRAVEGFNGKFKEHKSAIYIKASVVEFYGKVGVGADYRFRDYQPSHLTPCEMAILDCLIEVLK